jgi:hypothetical protein
MRLSLGPPVALVLFAATIAPAALPAQVVVFRDKRFAIQGGLLYNTVGSSAQVNYNGPGGGTAGTDFDLESMLGVPGTDQTGQYVATFHFGHGRHFIDGGFTNISRTGQRTLTDSLVYAGHTFLVGAEVQSTVGSQFPYAAWRFAFSNRDKFQASFSLGATYGQLNLGVAAAAGVVAPGGTDTTSGGAHTWIGAPVPLLGLNLAWRPHRRLVVDGFVRGFALSTQPLGGSVTQAGANAVLQVYKPLGVGVGYEFFQIDVTHYRKGNESGILSYTMNGLRVFGQLLF